MRYVAELLHAPATPHGVPPLEEVEEEVDNPVMVYKKIRSGTVVSCSPRGGRWLLGVKTATYCTEYYSDPSPRRIGEDVEILGDENRGVKIVLVGEDAEA